MEMKYFCAYHTYLKAVQNLSDAECGRLFKACLEYSMTGAAPELAGNERFAFEFIKGDIDRAKAAYQKKCDVNRMNVQKRWEEADFNAVNTSESDTNVYERIPSHTIVYERIQSKGKSKSKSKGKREGEGKSKSNSPNGENVPPIPPTGGLSGAQEQAFDEFWALYPKKKSKGQARKAWEKLKPSSEIVAAIMEKLPELMQSRDWTKDGGQYIPYPATWLNASGWEDEVTPAEQEESSNIFLQLLKEGAFDDDQTGRS